MKKQTHKELFDLINKQDKLNQKEWNDLKKELENF